MYELSGNLWDHYDRRVLAITTNGSIKKSGEAVMGVGCALEAAQRWPLLPRIVGTAIKQYGNHVTWIRFADHRHEIQQSDDEIITFPVKHNWWEKADLNLIKQSSIELVEKVDSYNEDRMVVIPRPGCGYGQLGWDEVKLVIEPILDDRFIIINKC